MRRVFVPTLAVTFLGSSAVARVAQADGPSCATDWTGAVYAQVRPAVVRYTYRFNTERIQSSTSQIVVGLWF